MQQILKRLELIKTSIAIEDEEIIELQVVKLSTMPIDDDVRAILTKLSNSDYGSAIIEIENYLSRYSGIAVYEDKELGGLKLELKVLEAKLQELSEEKNEYLNDLHEFNVQYNLYLGDIIRKILELKKGILYKRTILKRKSLDESQERYNQTKEEVEEIKEKLVRLKKELDEMDALDENYDELFEEFKNAKEQYKEKLDELNENEKEHEELEEEFENDPENQEYQESKNDYDEFYNEYEEIINQERYELSENDLLELKKAYRKASKLCHPDLVPSEHQDQALKLMQDLNEAYGKKDLNKVLQILTMLENGGGFDMASNTINNKELLKVKIEELRVKIDEVTQEIEEIKSDDTFATIQELDNWDEYFNALKVDLMEEQTNLETVSNSILENETNISQEKVQKANPTHDDGYWSSAF